MWLISGRDAFWTYLLGCGVDKLSLQSSGKRLVSSADVHGPPSSCRSELVVLLLALWAPLPLEDPEAPVVLTGTLRKWYPRPARGTAVSQYAYP